jgi:hypothetical protein
MQSMVSVNVQFCHLRFARPEVHFIVSEKKDGVLEEAEECGVVEEEVKNAAQQNGNSIAQMAEPRETGSVESYDTGTSEKTLNVQRDLLSLHADLKQRTKACQQKTFFRFQRRYRLQRLDSRKCLR